MKDQPQSPRHPPQYQQQPTNPKDSAPPQYGQQPNPKDYPPPPYQQQPNPKDYPPAPQPDPPEYPEPEEPQYPPCPEPKPCPQPPTRPCPPPEPDPCEETPPPEEPQEPCEPEQPEPYGAKADGSQDQATTPAQQLEALRKSAEKGTRELQKFEPLKAKLADVTQRIAALEKLIEGQPAATATYTEFYRATEVQRSSIECSIPTIRCQLSLTDKQKQCIRKAIAAVDERVKKAQDARDAQNAEVLRLERRQKKLQDELDWAKKWSEYFKTTLQTQVTAQREDLKKLLQQADPAKDQCEVWFYLSEMESLLRTARTNGEGDVCYRENINIATFLDCWSPKCYTAAYQHWIVTFNEAESAAKIGAIELSEAQKRAAELDKVAKEAETKRREWVLKELKAQDCCGPLSKCP